MNRGWGWGAGVVEAVAEAAGGSDCVPTGALAVAPAVEEGAEELVAEGEVPAEEEGGVVALAPPPPPPPIIGGMVEGGGGIAGAGARVR